MSTFIELTSKLYGDPSPILVNPDLIQSIYRATPDGCWITYPDEDQTIRVFESYEEIKAKLEEAS